MRIFWLVRTSWNKLILPHNFCHFHHVTVISQSSCYGHHVSDIISRLSCHYHRVTVMSPCHGHHVIIIISQSSCHCHRLTLVMSRHWQHATVIVSLLSLTSSLNRTNNRVVWNGSIYMYMRCLWINTLSCVIACKCVISVEQLRDRIFWHLVFSACSIQILAKSISGIDIPPSLFLQIQMRK